LYKRPMFCTQELRAAHAHITCYPAANVTGIYFRGQTLLSFKRSCCFFISDFLFYFLFSRLSFRLRSFFPTSPLSFYRNYALTRCFPNCASRLPGEASKKLGKKMKIPIFYTTNFLTNNFNFSDFYFLLLQLLTTDSVFLKIYNFERLFYFHNSSFFTVSYLVL
jgi:hypothetical protein